MAGLGRGVQPGGTRIVAEVKSCLSVLAGTDKAVMVRVLAEVLVAKLQHTDSAVGAVLNVVVDIDIVTLEVEFLSAFGAYLGDCPLWFFE